MFEIGDYVSTVIEGPVVGERLDERGLMFKVRYEDAEGFMRSKWLYPEDLYISEDDDEDGGEGDECCDREYVASAVATMH
jgi:hypothetical protein